ncbi:Uncharacterised protein [Mycobacterium tuberculosis]|nr:Uncharacterised protein [Mycobacterium tuberculosis]
MLSRRGCPARPHGSACRRGGQAASRSSSPRRIRRSARWSCRLATPERSALPTPQPRRSPCWWLAEVRPWCPAARSGVQRSPGSPNRRCRWPQQNGCRILRWSRVLRSSAPLLLIASLCIVTGATHLRRSCSSLRSASSPARLICAAPAHRFALHRHRRDSSAPLLLIASLCIVTGAHGQRRYTVGWTP